MSKRDLSVLGQFQFSESKRALRELDSIERDLCDVESVSEDHSNDSDVDGDQYYYFDEKGNVIYLPNPNDSEVDEEQASTDNLYDERESQQPFEYKDPLESLVLQDKTILTAYHLEDPNAFHVKGLDVNDPSFTTFLVKRRNDRLKKCRMHTRTHQIPSLFDLTMDAIVWSLDYMESLEGLPWSVFGEKIVQELQSGLVPICLEHISILANSYPMEFRDMTQRVSLRCYLNQYFQFRFLSLGTQLPTLLVELDISFCENVNDYLNPIIHMKALQVLNVSFTNVNDDSIITFLRPLSVNSEAGLGNLASLHLQGCKDVTDRILSHLKHLTKLERLVLSQTSTTRKSILHFAKDQGYRLQDTVVGENVRELSNQSKTMLEHWLMGIPFRNGNLTQFHFNTRAVRLLDNHRVTKILDSFNLGANIRILTRDLNNTSTWRLLNQLNAPHSRNEARNTMPLSGILKKKEFSTTTPIIAVPTTRPRLKSTNSIITSQPKLISPFTLRKNQSSNIQVQHNNSISTKSKKSIWKVPAGFRTLKSKMTSERK